MDGLAFKIAWAIEEREEVYLHCNKETGEWLWAVNLASDPGFWLIAFTTKKEAISFCKTHNLPIKEIINDKITN